MNRRASLLLVAAVALLVPAARAHADDMGGIRQQRLAPTFGENPPQHYESSQRFAVELKFGPYSPEHRRTRTG